MSLSDTVIILMIVRICGRVSASRFYFIFIVNIVNTSIKPYLWKSLWVQ